MKRTYTITISPALVAPALCWRWEVECRTRIDGEENDRDDLGCGLAASVRAASEAATETANRAEAAYIDGEDVT